LVVILLGSKITTKQNGGKTMTETNKKPETKTMREIIAETISKGNNARLKQLIFDLETINTQLEKIAFDFYMIATVFFKLTIPPSNPPAPPFEIPEYRAEAQKHKYAEYGCYIASLIILIFLTFNYLDNEWWLNALMVIFFFTIITLVLRLLTGLFNVSKENPPSVNRLKIASYVLTFLALSCVAIFALLRSLVEKEGISVMLWNYSMPAAELFFAFLAACCGEIKRFYSWSKDLKDEYIDLKHQANDIESEIDSISPKLPSNPATPNSTSANSTPPDNSTNTTTTDIPVKPVVAMQPISTNGDASVNEK
jgi:hypothetical protein